ncbi:unnamed protein product [Soboliphyme baturini]|uniref:LZTR1 n=1 Tax=Soboliphyme baturini TaxID=241478 RepID=A0A183INX9_9BILA|nr:unnamed protein product [Soboliphyme baturini]
MDINRCSSTEFSGCQFKLQASQKRIEMLENKVQRLQGELTMERDSKCLLEMEILKLKEVNKTLQEECRAAKSELKQFTQWFFNTLENPVSQTTEYTVTPTQDPAFDDIQSV